jgi:hypothetical protein
LSKSALFFTRQESATIVSDLISRRGYYALKVLGDFYRPYRESEANVFTPSPLVDYYLDRTFELCRSKGITVIYEAAPLSEYAFSTLSKEYVEGYQRYISSKAAKYPMHVISPALYSRPDIFFANPSHLNAIGAKIYTNTLKTNGVASRLLTR